MDDNYALQGNSDLSSSSSSNESDSSSSSSNGSDESSDDISDTDRDSSSDCNSVNDSDRDVASTDDNYFLSEDSSAESTESTDSFESTNPSDDDDSSYSSRQHSDSTDSNQDSNIIGTQHEILQREVDEQARHQCNLRKIVRASLLNSCLKMISSKLTGMEEKFNSMPAIDCDAFSFLITVDTVDGNSELNTDQFNAIRGFLSSFGTAITGISIPNGPALSKKRDSIFGSSQKQKCQHLYSRHCADFMQSSESLVINDPVKIAVHHTCKNKIISYLKNHHPRFYLSPSTTRGICFSVTPSSPKNLPSYDHLIDGVLHSCFVQHAGKFMIHVADVGIRRKMRCQDNDDCAIQKLFDLVETMRKTDGINVELTQFDVAFNIHSLNHLIRWSFPVDSKLSKKPSVFRGAKVQVFPIHSVQSNGRFLSEESEQTGTVGIKHENWGVHHDGSKVLDHYLPINAGDNPEDVEDLEPNNNWCPVMDRHFRRTIINDHAVFSMKAYSTIYHTFPVNRIRPMNSSSMNDLHKSTFKKLQTLSADLNSLSSSSLKDVMEHGICARLEISIRPTTDDVGNVLRQTGDLTHVLLHVHVAINDLLFLNRRRLRIHLSPTEPIRAKIHSLLNLINPMLQLRASNQFCYLYRDMKIHAWLKAIMSLILILVGFATEYKLKFVQEWLSDPERYDPSLQAEHIFQNFLYVRHEDSIPPASKVIPDISPTICCMINNILQKNGISQLGISRILEYIHSNAGPQSNSLHCLQSLTLQDKLEYAFKCHDQILPDLLLNQSSKNNSGEIPDDVSDPHEEIEMSHSASLDEWRIYNQFGSRNFLNSSTQMTQGTNHQFRTPFNTIEDTQDPIAYIASKLDDLSNYSDQRQLIYIYRLYNHIRLCHEHNICLAKDKPLPSLTSSDGHTMDTFLKNAVIVMSRNSSDLRSLKIICKGLNVPFSGPNSKAAHISALASHYCFPCCPDPDEYIKNEITLNCKISENEDILNTLLNKVYEEPHVLSLPHHTTRQNHFFKANDASHIYIVPGNQLVHPDALQGQTRFQSDDFYEVLEQYFLPISSGGNEFRARLNNCLCQLTPLCEYFIQDDATRNSNFCNTQSLAQLQEVKQFRLTSGQDSLYLFMNMIPEIILPATSLVYESDLFFADYDKGQCELHIYQRSFQKVITYCYIGTAHTPRAKCVMFIKTGGIYEHIHVENGDFVDYNCLTLPVSTSVEICLPSYGKHPQGNPVTHRKGSYSKSILHLLKTDRVNHAHFRGKADDCLKDPLDLIPYLQDLLSYFRGTSLLNFMQESILIEWKKDSDSPFANPNSDILVDEAVKFLVENDHDKLHHIYIYPFLCLKYKLWIAVWEMEKKQHYSHFYFFNPNTKKVSHTMFNGLVYKRMESQYLYIKSSIGTSKNSLTTGYWRAEEENPFTANHTIYTYATLLRTKYSYLDGPTLSKLKEIFFEHLGVSMLDRGELQHPIAAFGASKPSFVITDVLLDRLNCERYLVVFYPYHEETRKYPTLAIHCSNNVDVIEQDICTMLGHIDQDALDEYDLGFLFTRSKCDFAYTFQLMLYMYVAHSTRDCSQLCNIIGDLLKEVQVVQKTKEWFADVIDGYSQITSPPHWLRQTIQEHL